MKMIPLLRTLTLASLVLPSAALHAEDYDIAANGPWTTAGTWTPSIVDGPTALDTITIDGITAVRTVGLSGTDILHQVTSLSYNSTFQATFESTGGTPILTLSGNLTKDGTGTLAVRQNGGNLRLNVGGDVLVNSGTLFLGAGSSNSNRLRSVTVTGNTSVAAGATLSANVQGSNASYGATSLNGLFLITGAETTASGMFNGLTGSGTFSGNAGGATTYTVRFSQTAGTSDFSGRIEQVTGTVAVSMQGAGGTQILSGANTYTGATTVSAGTLLVNGSTSESSAVSVTAQGTLGGVGTVGGTTTITGTLTPGSGGAGALTFTNGLTMNNNSTLAFEGGDLVAVGGALDLNETWKLTLGSGFVDGGSVVLFTFGTLVDTPFLLPTIDAAGLGFDPTLPLTVSVVGNTIVLDGISAVPEPATGALLFMGVGVALWLRRARRTA